MKTRSAIVFVLFALAMLSAGYLLGWHQRAEVGSSAANLRPDSAQMASGKSSSLPPVKSSLPGQSGASPSAVVGKMSLADVEARMLKLKYGDWYRDQDWRKILDNLDPAGIPQLLAFVDAKVPKRLQEGLRSNLLPRWAQSDPQAAMVYAQALPNLQERQNAIGMVASGWAQKDPTGAAAWAQQLPKGQLRDRVMNSVISALAGSNPQAAFDLLQSSGLNAGQFMPAYNLFSTWANQDPATAAAQAAKLLPAASDSKRSRPSRRPGRKPIRRRP